MRKAKSERGQALGELTISLIGLCAVMIGMLTVACLGMNGVRNTIAAREEADHYSFNSIKNGSPDHISTWEKGADGIPFTNDDNQIQGASPNSEIFLGTLTDNTGTFKTAQLAETRYAEQAFEARVVESELLLSAANLTQAEKIISDPLSLYRHFDAARILRSLGFPSRFSIRDQISMPVNTAGTAGTGTGVTIHVYVRDF